ncbi:MAG: MASE1 domain-containing protein, partial [Alphaproteobacteria bacterium]
MQETDSSRRGPVGLVQVAGFAACYFIAALGSQIFLQYGDAVSPVSSPVGLLLGILLRTRRGTWPVWVAISVAALVMAHALVGRPVGAALAFSVGDAVGAAAGALLVERFCGWRFRLDSLSSLASLISLAAVAAPLGAAGVAAGYLHLAIGHPLGLVYASGWTSMFTSIVLVTPAVLLWRRDWPTGWIRAARGLEFGGLATGAVLLPVLVFWLSEGPLLPLVMLPLLWAAIRFGPFEAAAGNLVLGVVASAAAVAGAGAAFGQPSGPVETMVYMQAFLALMAIGPSLTVALALAEARRAGTPEGGDARLQALLDYSPMAIAVRDFDGRYLTVNRRFCEWYGDVDTAGGRTTIHDVFAKPVADEMAAFARRIIAERQPIQHEFEVVLRDGEQHRISVVSFPILDHAGVVTAIGGIGFDVTDARRAEDQLRQAQKMEAVGQLTGGLAHDFNNLLAVILGNLELLLETLPEQGKNRARTRSALRAAERGAALTHRLLAFSRKQALKPVALDLNQVIRSMRSLLQQSLGKQVTVEIVAAAGLWRCEADPVQVESALLNLANNARDAMPAGGKLTIETGNVRLDDEQAAALGDVGPGEYVMIAVADTGEGMSEEV